MKYLINKYKWHIIILTISTSLYIIGGGGIHNFISVTLMAGAMSQSCIWKNPKWYFIMLGFQIVWLILMGTVAIVSM